MSSGLGKAGKAASATRDLELAKKAYDLRDVETSKAAHQQSQGLVKKNTEQHAKFGGYIKSIVYGGLVRAIPARARARERAIASHSLSFGRSLTPERFAQKHTPSLKLALSHIL